MFSASTFRDRRPEAMRSFTSSGSNVHREDEQPNEEINKRQRVRPPLVVPVSAPLPGRNHRARDSPVSDSAAIVQRSRSGWTQHGVRGNKAWRGARGGRSGRGMGQEFRRTGSSPHQRYASATSDHTSDTPSPRWNDGRYDHHQRTPAYMPAPMARPIPRRYPYPTQSTPQTYMASLPPVLPLRQQGMNGEPMELLSSTMNHSSSATSPPVPGTRTLFNQVTSSTHPTDQIPQLPLPTQTEPEIADMLPPSAIPSSLSRNITPPLKRRRLDHTPDPRIKSEVIEDRVIFPTAARQSTSPPPIIKPELRSPSPPSRRLIKESCTLYPLPDDCRKMNPNPNPDYLKNRNALAAKERAMLKRRGLKTEKVLFRDDGMVIEWTSSVPVWSDTLLPESPMPPEKTVPQRRPMPLPVPKAKASRRSPSRDTDKRTSTTPASPKERRHSLSADVPLSAQRDRRLDGVRAGDSVRAISISASPSPPPSSKAKGKAKAIEAPQYLANLSAVRRPLPLPKPRPKRTTPAEPPPQHVHVTRSILDNEPSTSYDRGDAIKVNAVVTTHAWSVVELEDVEPMALNYFQRYIRTFDASPSTLRHAYAPYAVFSVRTASEGSTETAGPSSLPSSPIKICQGPDEITERLALVAQYKFCLGQGMNVQYDVVSLSAAAGGGIFLTMHGEVVDTSVESRRDPASSRVLSVDQAFVLQKNPGSKAGGEGGDEEGWPLVAVSHQMVIRDAIGWRSVEKEREREEEFPWLV